MSFAVHEIAPRVSFRKLKMAALVRGERGGVRLFVGREDI
jgi:hypothetical protein